MYTHEQKVSHLKALYHLACADKDFSNVEAIYIKNVAERLGVKLEELRNFNPASEPPLDLPDTEFKIYSLFHRLAIIIMVDESINETEKRYCFNLGIKMGLHPNALHEIIEHVIAHGSMGASPEKIMGIFKKYMS